MNALTISVGGKTWKVGTHQRVRVWCERNAEGVIIDGEVVFANATAG